MKISYLLEADKNSIQPTDYTSVKANAERVFGDELGFYVVEKNNPTNRTAVFSYEENDIVGDKEIQEEEKKQALDNFTKKHGLKKITGKRGKISFPDAVVVPVYAQSPDLNPDGTVNPAELPTYSQRVSNTRGDYTDSRGKLLPEKLLELGVITADNVKKVLRNHPSHTLNEKYTDRLIDRLLTPGAWTPQIIIDNVAEFNLKTRIQPGKYLSDFGEIAGPLGLVCKSINGNGVRMLPYFFAGGDTKIPSAKDIKKEATIHFHPSKTHSLVDSYIEFRGQVVRVSSKAAGGELSGGSGASFIGIFQSIAEISKTKEGVDAFNKLLRSRPQALASLNKLKILANVASEDDTKEIGWLTKVQLIKDLIDSSEKNIYNIAVTDSDIEILKTLWTAAGENLSNMHEFKRVIGRALGSEVDARLPDSDLGVGEFSPGFKNIIRSFNLNKYGEPGRSNIEDPKQTDAYNSTRGWWDRFQGSLVNAIANIVNRDPDFSFLCTWILNHGSFIQIDLRSIENSKTEQLIITNISATWPSTAVDKVTLVPVSKSSGFSYKLLINSDRDWPEVASNFTDPELAKIYSDDTFGFTDAKTVKNLRDASKIAKYDLLRFNRQWAELLKKSEYANYPDSKKSKEGEKTRNKSTNATLVLNSTFKNLATANIIWSSNPQATVNDLVARILKGELDPQFLTYVDRSAEYALRYFHTLSDNPDEWLNEHRLLENTDDEDDDEDDDGEIPGVKSVKITRTDRERAVRDLTRARNLIEPIYFAVQIDNALRNGEDLNQIRELEQRLTLALSKLKKSQPLNVSDLINNRKTNLEPRVDNRDFVPPGFNKERADKQRGTTAAIARMKQFLNKFQSIIPKGKYAGIRRVNPTFSSIGNFINGILDGNNDNQISEINTEFRALLKDPTIVEIIKSITLASINHPPEINAVIDEDNDSVKNNFTNDREIATAITFIYWSLLVKSYIDNKKTDTEQFREVVKNAASVAKYVFNDAGNYSSFLRAIRTHLSDVDNYATPKVVITVYSNIFNKAVSPSSRGVPGFAGVWNQLDHDNKERVRDEMFDYMTKNMQLTTLANDAKDTAHKQRLIQQLVAFTKQQLASQESPNNR